MLPQYVVVILEDDVIKYLDYTEYGDSAGYKEVISWFCKEFQAIAKGFKARIPEKAVSDRHPHFIWICAAEHNNYPLNNNNARRRFNNTLKEVVKTFPDQMVYQLEQQSWVVSNNKLVDPKHQRITTDGISTFWKAADKTMKYGISRLQWTKEKAIVNAAQQRQQNHNRERTRSYYEKHGREGHWSGPNRDRYRVDHRKENKERKDDRRKLPTPPRRT